MPFHDSEPEVGETEASVMVRTAHIEERAEFEERRRLAVFHGNPRQYPAVTRL